MTDTFFIDKTTGTFSDELLAAGFIRLLENLMYRQGEKNPAITQTDVGYYYRIEVAPELDTARLDDQLPAIPLAPVLRTAKNRNKLPDLPENPLYVVDYAVEKEKRQTFFNAFGDLEGTLKRAYAVGDDGSFPFERMPPPPHEKWDVFALLNAPPMPINGYNQALAQWWAVGEAGEAGAVCRLLCHLFSQTPNDLDTAVKTWKQLAKPRGWKDRVTASQFFNPSQGKGVNKPQPDGVGLGNVKSFWLLELLKAAGFYHTAITRRVKGSDDRKTYVPAPGRADARAQEKALTRFRKKMRFGETAVRADIFTVIRYLQAFMEQVEAAQEGGEAEQWLLALLEETKRPSSFLRGFHVVYYKSLGTAAATMNIAFLNLPGWIEINGRDDMLAYQEILDEHRRIVEQLAENKGEELDLLQMYRDFVVADHLDPFFNFTAAYSSWLTSAGEKSGFPPRRFTTCNLRRLIVSKKPELAPILDSPGFRNIAYAIRQSTVIAQYRRKQGDRRYDVRYGLGRDLVRQSQYPDEFVAALSDFLQKYNAENAQVMETRSGPYRRSVKTGDIQEILQLIDEYGSDLIAKLLTAYGYARDPRQDDEPETKETEA